MSSTINKQPNILATSQPLMEKRAGQAVSVSQVVKAAGVFQASAVPVFGLANRVACGVAPLWRGKGHNGRLKPCSLGTR